MTCRKDQSLIDVDEIHAEDKPRADAGNVRADEQRPLALRRGGGRKKKQRG